MKSYVKTARKQAEARPRQGRGNTGRVRKASRRSVQDARELGTGRGNPIRPSPRSPQCKAGRHLERVKAAGIVLKDFDSRIILTVKRGLPGGVKVTTGKCGPIRVQVNEKVHRMLTEDAKAHGGRPESAIIRLIEQDADRGLMQRARSTRSQSLQAGFLPSLPTKDRTNLMRRIEALPAIRSGELSFEDFALFSIQKGLEEVEATGVIRLPFAPCPLPPKLSQRFAELDSVMELEPGEGVAEGILSELVGDMLNGTDDRLEQAWTFDKPEEARRLYASLLNKWRKQDGRKPLPLSRLCPRPWTGTEAAKVEGGARA